MIRQVRNIGFPGIGPRVLHGWTGLQPTGCQEFGSGTARPFKDGRRQTGHTGVAGQKPKESPKLSIRDSEKAAVETPTRDC